MKSITYQHHTLGPHMEGFITYKRQQGYDYTYETYLLCKLDRFLVKHSYQRSILSDGIIKEYVDSTASMGPVFRNSCLSCLRVFSKYLNMLFPESCILNELPVKICKTIRFYIYSQHDICELMKAAGHLRNTGVLRRACIRFLIGLLACTGLRINEALSLTLGDVDLIRRRIFVRKGKFDKQRYIPLCDNTVRQIEQWLEVRKRYVTDTPASYLFVTDPTGVPLNDSRARRAFRFCRRWCGIECRDKPPRLHDLRHTCACRCLLLWQLQGKDINAKLPILSTVLGHVNISSTQVYLHITPAQLQKASGQFYSTYNI